MQEKKSDRLHEILSTLMKESDLNDAKLSHYVGIPMTTIARIRSDPAANPTISSLRPIAKFFKISIGQLVGDEPLSANRLPGEHSLEILTTKRVPILDWDKLPNWLKKSSDSQSAILDWISTEKEVSDEAFALIIPTDSLSLIFRKNTLILADPMSSPKNGDFVIIQTLKKNHIMLKQFISEGDEKYLKSINPEIKHILPFEESNCKIIGTIKEARYNFSLASKQVYHDEKNTLFYPEKVFLTQ